MAPLEGSDECFSLDSPRSMEACRRRGLENSDLEERSQESFFRHEQPQQRRRRPLKSRSPEAGQEQSYGKADTTAAIRQERHEINRHRLLREVKKERSELVRGDKNKTKTINSASTAPQRLQRFRPVATAPVSPYSPSRNTVCSSFSKCEDSSSLVSTALDSSSVGSNHRHHGDNATRGSRRTPRLSRAGEAGNPVLQGEVQRLESLKRRRFMELQQTLAFQLRGLAREERDRILAEKARAREAMAEEKRSKMLEAADRARIARERSGQERAKEVERQDAVKSARQQEAARRLEAQDHLRRRQAEVAVERRMELAAQKAALLQARIDRGVRVRRAQQLRTERVAAQKADEREAGAEAARRARESEHEAKKAAAAEKWAATRAAAEEVRRRHDEETEAMRAATGGSMAELEGRVASFRSRQKEIAARERELREEEAAELARERQEIAWQKVARDMKRKADEVEAKLLREEQIALAREVQRKQEEEERRAERLRKEETRKRIIERRAKAEVERREATRRKLEEDTAKIELLLSEKERLQATRGQLSWETAKQRRNLQGQFKSLKDQSSHGCSISYGSIAAAVTAAAAAGDSGTAPTPANRRPETAAPGLLSPKTRRAAEPASRDAHVSPSPSSRILYNSSREQASADCGQTAPPPQQTESSLVLSGVSTASSLSLPHGSGGVGGGERASEKTPRKLRKPASGGGSRSRGITDLRKRYMYGESGKKAVGTRVTKQTTTPRNKNIRRGKPKPIAAGGDGGDGEGGAPATYGDEEATISTETPATKNGEEAVTVSCNADDSYDEDEILTAATTLLSSSTTVANTPASPPPPPVASDTDLLRGRYDRELLAILEEEQAAETAREKALAAAKAGAKAARARATYRGTGTAGRTNRSDKRSPSPATGRPSPITDGGGGGDLEQRRVEEAEVAEREEAQLKQELARERREASERVMRVSEEYERALEELSSGKKVCSSAEEPAAREGARNAA